MKKIVKLLKLLEQEDCHLLSVEHKSMDLSLAQKLKIPYDVQSPAPYWDLKIQIPADKIPPSD